MMLRALVLVHVLALQLVPVLVQRCVPQERGRCVGGWVGGGYDMVWYALRYREWLAGRSLTLPVFRARVRGQLAVTLGCCPPDSWGGGGVVVAALTTSPSPRAPASCAGPVPVVPVQCVPKPPMP